MLRARSLPACAAAVLVSAAAFGATPPVNVHPELRAIAGAVKAATLHAPADMGKRLSVAARPHVPAGKALRQL